MSGRYQVVMHPAVRDELSEIVAWYLDRSYQGALRWLDRLQTAMESLSRFPERGRVAPESRFLGFTVRQRVVGNYRILYTVEPKRVVVLYVRHGARRRLRRKDRRLPPV